MLRINFFQNLHDIIWGVGIEKEHQILKTEPLRNILLLSQKLTIQLDKLQ